MLYLCLGSLWDLLAFKFSIHSVEGVKVQLEEKDDYREGRQRVSGI